MERYYFSNAYWSRMFLASIMPMTEKNNYDSFLKGYFVNSNYQVNIWILTVIENSNGQTLAVNKLAATTIVLKVQSKLLCD